MKELQEYYKKWQKRLFTIAIIVWLGYSILFLSLKGYLIFQNNVLFNYLVSLVLGCISPTAIVALGYFGILDYIDKTGWKKKYPNLDISGEWDDDTKYTHCMTNGSFSTIESFESPAKVIINQTCRSVEIPPSTGEDFTWNSISVEWGNDGYLNILYQVRYNNATSNNRFPELRIGFEQMCIDRDSLSKKGKPTKMKGKFWHCISGDGKPVYMGDVTYSRNIDK